MSDGYETDDERQIRGLRETIAELAAERDALKALLVIAKPKLEAHRFNCSTWLPGPAEEVTELLEKIELLLEVEK